MSTTRFSTYPGRVSIGLAVLRLAVGIIFIAHGAQKFFVYGLDGATGAFGQMGVPLPSITAPLTAAVELLAGAALIAGLLTTLAAIGLALDMLGAIVLVRAKGGFFAPNGMEFELALFAACAAIALAGPGAFALDAVLQGRSATHDAA